MGSIMRKNYKALEEHNGIPCAYFPVLNQITQEELAENIKFEDGQLYFKERDAFYRLFSKRKEEEFLFLTQELEDLKDHLIVVFGMGNFRLLKYLNEFTTPGTRIMVFEPNDYIAKYILKNENLVDVIKSDKFAFVLGDQELRLKSITFYLQQKWDNLARNIVVIKNPNYHVYQEFVQKNVHVLTSKIDTQIKNLGTSLEDMLDGFEFMYRNVDQCMKCNNIKEIEGKYEGYPAIIVSAGPSLAKNIQYLKRAKGKALILACDASYPACVKQGVKPEVIASIERYVETYDYYYKGKEFPEDLVLAGPPVLWPKLFDEFPGKKIIMAKGNGGLDNWWLQLFEDIEFVYQGMSCATVAYATAKKAGCDPIILIGQDLAFTDNKLHSEDTHSSIEGENIGAPDDDPDTVWVKDIHGNMVKSDIYYNLFRSYFEDAISIKGDTIIDATEGGALIEGSIIMDFKDAIEQYCTREIPFKLYDFLKGVQRDKEYCRKKYVEVIQAGKKILGKLNDTRDEIIKYYKGIEKYNEFDFKNASEEELVDAVLTMQESNKFIDYLIKNQPELTSYYQQVVKQTIISVKGIGNQLTGKNVEKNYKIQLAFMHLVEVATLATGKRFEEMIAFMENKMKCLEGEKNGE